MRDDAVSSSLDRSDDGIGSMKEERGDGAEADPAGGQLGGRGRDWGFGPSGELSITAGGLRSRPFLGQPKMTVPVLKARRCEGEYRHLFKADESLCKAAWIRTSP